MACGACLGLTLLALGACSPEPTPARIPLLPDPAEPSGATEEPKVTTLVDVEPEPVAVDAGGLQVGESPSQDEADRAAEALIDANTWQQELERLEAEILKDAEPTEGVGTDREP